MIQSTAETHRWPGLQSLALTARRFAADSSGATAVEYGLIVAAIALAIVALVFEIGGSVRGMFEKAAGIYGN